MGRDDNTTEKRAILRLHHHNHMKKGKVITWEQKIRNKKKQEQKQREKEYKEKILPDINPKEDFTRLKKSYD